MSDYGVAFEQVDRPEGFRGVSDGAGGEPVLDATEGRMKTLLVALLLLVVGIGPAFAECAWVLWEETLWLNPGVSASESFGMVFLPARKAKDWGRAAVGTFSNKVTCEEGLSDEIKLRSKRAGSVVAGNKVFRAWKWPDGLEEKQVSRYFCLPDTVKPD